MSDPSLSGADHFRLAETASGLARKLRKDAVPAREADTADLVREALTHAQVHATLAAAAYLGELVEQVEMLKTVIVG